VKKIILGLTGGIASGKTTAAGMFADKGAKLIDADSIAHKVLREDREVQRKIAEAFGPEYVSGGEVDRRALARKVFSGGAALDILSGIIHPPVIAAILKELEKSGDEDVVVIDAPLLIESGMHKYVDAVVLVTAGRDKQLERAAGRGLSEKEINYVIDKQMSQAEKEKFAQYILDNGASIDETKKGVDRIWQKVQKKRKKKDQSWTS